MASESKCPPNPLPCGCGVMGTMDLDCFDERVRYKNLHVKFCPLHSAAPDLLAALATYVGLCGNTAYMVDRTGLMVAYEMAEAAILKARPAKKKRAEENRHA